MLDRKRKNICMKNNPTQKLKHLLILHYKVRTWLKSFPIVSSYTDLSVIFTCHLVTAHSPHLATYLKRKLRILLTVHLLHLGLLRDNQSLASPLPSIIRGWMCQLSYTPTNLDTITPFITPGTPAHSARLTSKVAWSAWEQLINLDCYLIAVLQKCLQALIKIEVLNTKKTYLHWKIVPAPESS